MNQSESKQPLLEGQQYGEPVYYLPPRKSTFKFYHVFVTVIVLLSLTGNVVLVYQQHSLLTQPEQCRSKYTGLPLEVPLVYNLSSEYNSENKTHADKLWDAIDTSSNVIALTDEYAEEHDIPIAPARFPWDENKGIYHVKAFHHLHCLKNLYRSFTDYRNGNEQIIAPWHIYHCLDILRQDVMCFADDTPMPTGSEKNQIGHGQVRQCKSIEKLIAWTQHTDHHACFRMLSDYREIPHSLEEFAFCPPESPYFEIARDYFDEHGHKDPFVE